MQPSSDQSGGGAGASSSLRRFGPIAAIVAVIAVVIGVVVAGGGDDGDDDPSASETTEASDGDGARPEGAISFSQAEAEGLDVTFPDTCDTELGTVAIPVNFAPECYADVDDNGGATHTGVTEDSISLVIYNAPDADPVLDFVTGPIANDDTAAQVRETTQTYVDLFNEYFQTYGRTVEVNFLQASGISTDEVAARADAKRAIEEFAPFAAIGGPALTNAWSDEMAAAGVVCVGCGLSGGQEYLAQRDPYLYAGGMTGLQNNLHVADYVEARLKGGKAEFGGDAVKDQDRVFGHLYIRSTEESDRTAETLHALLADRGVEIADEAIVSYELDPARLPEQATSAISKFKNAGVTTVVLQGDPVGPKNFTEAATEQDFFPEWVIAGGVLMDTTVFGRVFDQEQWQHAFGITSITARQTPDLDPGVFLHEWYTGEPAPAIDTAPVLWGNPFTFFRALQLAGPELTPESFQAGMFSFEDRDDRVTNSHGEWGRLDFWDEIGVEIDYSGTDDKVEIWYDADATGLDEISNEGTGMLCYVAGGERYLPGEWEGSEDLLFEEDSCVYLYEEPPPGEEAPDYPSPAG